MPAFKTMNPFEFSLYTKYIRSHADWEFVGVYTDEGISALSTAKRDGFNQMVSDALEGKIQLIVTKSVSRFAHNTVDSLTTIRNLKSHGVEVYFEKENIWTFDAKGELLITLMSSLAQEESRSISENVTWGRRKCMADGQVCMPYGHFLGYKKGPDGKPEIVPEEADLVRRIYKEFMSGMAASRIAKTLTKDGVPTPGGRKKWQISVIESILSKLRTTYLIRRKRQHPLKTACYKGFCGQGGAFRLMCGAGKRAGMRIGPCTMDTITL